MGSVLSIIMRLFLGGLFILAGVLKLSDPQTFAEAIKAFKILPEHVIAFAAYGLPWIEIIAGGLLIIGLWTRAAALLITVLLAAFTAGIVSVILRGIDTKCSCFGELEWPCAGDVGQCQIIRNSVLMLAGVIILAVGPGRFAAEGPRRVPVD